jgi:hypothetical protein
MLSVKTVWEALSSHGMDSNTKFGIVAQMIDAERATSKLPWEQYEDMTIELRRLAHQEPLTRSLDGDAIEEQRRDEKRGLYFEHLDDSN